MEETNSFKYEKNILEHVTVLVFSAVLQAVYCTQYIPISAIEVCRPTTYCTQHTQIFRSVTQVYVCIHVVCVCVWSGLGWGGGGVSLTISVCVVFAFCLPTVPSICLLQPSICLLSAQYLPSVCLVSTFCLSRICLLSASYLSVCQASCLSNICLSAKPTMRNKHLQSAKPPKPSPPLLPPPTPPCPRHTQNRYAGSQKFLLYPINNGKYMVQDSLKTWLAILKKSLEL